MLPKHIDVQGVRIEVKQRLARHDRELKDCYGYYDPAGAYIVVRKDLSAEMKRATLAHEIAHAMIHHSGFGYTMTKLVDQEAHEFFEEQMIRKVIVPYVLTARAYKWLHSTRL